MHPCNSLGLWTVNKKSEECLTLQSGFLELSYELNINMKCLALLLLGDVKNLLKPPRIVIKFQNVDIFENFALTF